MSLTIFRESWKPSNGSSEPFLVVFERYGVLREDCRRLGGGKYGSGEDIESNPSSAMLLRPIQSNKRAQCRDDLLGASPACSLRPKPSTRRWWLSAAVPCPLIRAVIVIFRLGGVSSQRKRSCAQGNIFRCIEVFSEVGQGSYK